MDDFDNTPEVEFLENEGGKEYVINRSVEEVVEEKTAEWLVEHKIASTTKQAKWLLIGISIIFLLASAFILYLTMVHNQAAELQKKMKGGAMVEIYRG